MGAKVVSLGELVCNAREASLPAPSAVTAKTFILAVRDAGMVLVDGRRVRDAGKIRADEASAIAAFVGYDKGGAHGAQLDAATRVAHRLLSTAVKDPAATTHYSRGATASVAGFVAGMPDGVEHQRGVLIGLIQEKLDEAREALASNDHAKLATVEGHIRQLRARLGSLG